MSDDALFDLAAALDATGYGFTTVSPATHARVNARPGNAWARTTQDVFGWSRPFRLGVLPAPLFAAMQKADVVEPHGDREGDGWISRVRAATLQGRTFLHSAYPTTASDAVFLGPDTYRFADAITRHLAGNARVARAIDIGCGAGPGAVVVALARPGAEVIGVDINPQALRYTAVNARLAGAEHVAVVQSDLLQEVGGSFDLIVANPPYLLDAGERTYRHGGGSLGEGLSLSIAGLAVARLSPGGTLLLYTGTAIVDGHDRFRSAVGRLLSEAGVHWHYQELDPDVFGEELSEPAYAAADRIAAVLLTVHSRPYRPHPEAGPAAPPPQVRKSGSRGTMAGAWDRAAAGGSCTGADQVCESPSRQADGSANTTLQPEQRYSTVGRSAALASRSMTGR